MDVRPCDNPVSENLECSIISVPFRVCICIEVAFMPEMAFLVDIEDKNEVIGIAKQLVNCIFYDSDDKVSEA